MRSRPHPLRLRRFHPVLPFGLAAALASCSGGTPPPEFERFDPAVTPGPEDHPDVPGVVLLDRGTLFLTADPATKNPIARLRRYRRVKILRASGAELARVVVPHDPGSVISGLTVRAVLPSGDTLSVGEENFANTAHESGRRAKAVQVPANEPGTIIEHTYDLYVSDPRFLTPWVFQCALPTVRSEFAVVVPRGFNVDLRYSIDGIFADKPAERFDTDEGTRYSWSEANLPARFPEPGMPSPELLAPRAHVIMLGAKVGARDYAGFGSWDDVGAWFVSRVPEWANLSPATVAEAKRIAGETSMEEQALKLLSVVARDLEWEGGPELPLWQTRIVHPEIVLKERRGNKVTRGLLLVSLLRAIGIPAVPALAAYRDRGMLLPDLPTISELDLVVAVIPRDQGPLVLDPSQLTVSVDVPSPRIQGTRVVTLREDGAEVILVPISGAADSKSSISYDLELDTRGDLFGSMEARLTGAEAGELRGLLFRSDPGTYADLVSSFLQARGAGLAVDNANISDLGELRRPLIVKGSVSLKRAAPAEGTRVALRVGRIVGSADSEGRLRETRRSPLTIGAPRTIEVVATVVLPEDYEIQQLAPGLSERWSGGTIDLKLRSESKRRVGISRTSALVLLDVPPQQYSEYRRFREAVVAAERGELVLERPPTRALEY